MSKKSSLGFLENLSPRTQSNYMSTIRKYEEYHRMDIEELVNEALDEQHQHIPSDMLTIISRIEDFQNQLILDGMVYGAVATIIGRIKTLYKKNRVVLPYLTPINNKKVRRREYITFNEEATIKVKLHDGSGDESNKEIKIYGENDNLIRVSSNKDITQTNEEATIKVKLHDGTGDNSDKEVKLYKED